MKANLNELIMIKTQEQAETYINTYFEKINSPITQMIKVFEVYKEVGTKKAPYGFDHGYYDSTIVDHVIHDWVKVSENEYNKFDPGYTTINGESDYKRIRSEKTKNNLLFDYNSIEVNTISNCKKRIRVLNKMSEEVFELSQELYELSDEIEQLEDVAILFSYIHSKYSTEINRVKDLISTMEEHKVNNQKLKEIQRAKGLVKLRKSQLSEAIDLLNLVENEVIIVDPKNDKL